MDTNEMAECEEALATAMHTANYRVMPCFDRHKPLDECFLVESHRERAGEILAELNALGWVLVERDANLTAWATADAALEEVDVLRTSLERIAETNIMAGATAEDAIQTCRRMKETAHTALDWDYSSR